MSIKCADLGRLVTVQLAAQPHTVKMEMSSLALPDIRKVLQVLIVSLTVRYALKVNTVQTKTPKQSAQKDMSAELVKPLKSNSLSLQEI